MYNVAVIGAGVIGVTTALQLQKDIKNVKVTIFAEKFSPETTGDLSAGLWTPYLLEDNLESDITRWSKVTHDELHKLWRAGLAKKAGICLQPVLRLFTDENIQQPHWLNVPFGATTLSDQQVEKLSQQHGKKYTCASHYISFTCEPTKLLPYLMQIFLQRGGNVVHKKVQNFGELLHFDVVLNCAGLEARKLAHDEKLHAIRGQICRVKAPWQFQVLSDESDDGNYIIPNVSYVILGGTHQIDDERLSVCPQDKNLILTGCARMVPGLKTCVEELHGVGLRPGRNKVRLEEEIIKVGDKTLNVVHNYGHGGAGVTLCFGCAEDASKLVRKSLKLDFLTSHL